MRPVTIAIMQKNFLALHTAPVLREGLAPGGQAIASSASPLHLSKHRLWLPCRPRKHRGRGAGRWRQPSSGSAGLDQDASPPPGQCFCSDGSNCLASLPSLLPVHFCLSGGSSKGGKEWMKQRWQGWCVEGGVRGKTEGVMNPECWLQASIFAPSRPASLEVAVVNKGLSRWLRR